MYTKNDLRQRLIDYLYTVDLSKMNMQDLNSYAFAVKTVSEISELGYAELMSTLLCNARKEADIADG